MGAADFTWTVSGRVGGQPRQQVERLGHGHLGPGGQRTDTQPAPLYLVGHRATQRALARHCHRAITGSPPAPDLQRGLLATDNLGYSGWPASPGPSSGRGVTSRGPVERRGTAITALACGPRHPAGASLTWPRRASAGLSMSSAGHHRHASTAGTTPSASRHRRLGLRRRPASPGSSAPPSPPRRSA